MTLTPKSFVMLQLRQSTAAWSRCVLTLQRARGGDQRAEDAGRRGCRPDARLRRGARLMLRWWSLCSYSP